MQRIQVAEHQLPADDGAVQGVAGQRQRRDGEREHEQQRLDVQGRAPAGSEQLTEHRRGERHVDGKRAQVCRYTASVTSSGGRLCPRIRLPSRVVQLHLVALLVTIPSTGWRGDATQLLERAGVVIGQRCSAMPPDAQGPCLPSPQ